MAKCKHGVHVPEFYTGKSPYCSACYPHGTADRPLRLSMSKKHRASGPRNEEPAEMDSTEFMAQPAGARLAQLEELA